MIKKENIGKKFKLGNETYIVIAENEENFLLQRDNNKIIEVFCNKNDKDLIPIGDNKMSKEFIYKVTKFYEVAELPEKGYGRVKWVKDTSEPETIHKWTQENYDNACGKDTLKYFRKVFNSRQVLKTKTNKNTHKTTTILYSYAPDSLTYRSTFIIEEI